MSSPDSDKKAKENDITADAVRSDHNPAGARKDAGEKEIGGRKGLDPTRYGDWEKAGRCIDF